jgi:hypothetical protein
MGASALCRALIFLVQKVAPPCLVIGVMLSAASLYILPALALMAGGQRRAVFSFDSTQITPWPGSYASQTPVQYNSKRPSSIGTAQVSVIGNFGGTFTVSGIGSSSSSRSDELINITTNRPLTFLAANFTILYAGLSQANTAGNITYEMQLYAGSASSVGAALTGAVGGTDNSFNGSTLVLSSGIIPANGQVVLRLSRTLNLTQYAEGQTTYTASGVVIVSIN